MKNPEQYIEYYAKYSLINLKGSKSEVTKMGIPAQICFFENGYMYLLEAKFTLRSESAACASFLGQTSYVWSIRPNQ